MIEAKLADIVRAESDGWWIAIFFIVAIVKVLQFIFKAKKDIANKAPPDPEDKSASDELEDFFSGLTQIVKEKAAPDHIANQLPPSIAAQLENEASASPQANAVQQRSTPKPAPERQHYVASTVSDTYKNKENDLSFAEQPHSTPGQWKKTKPGGRAVRPKINVHPEKADTHVRAIKAEQLFPAIPLLSEKKKKKPSRFAVFRTRGGLKAAIVSREALGPPRALMPYGFERHL